MIMKLSFLITSSWRSEQPSQFSLLTYLRAEQTTAATMALSSPTATFRNPSATFTVRRFTAFTSSCTHLRLPSILVRVPMTVKCRQSAEYDYEDSPASFARAQREPAFSPRSNSVPYYTGGKVFTNYRVYKGKAVLDLEPKPPELAPLGTGLFKVAKEGYILLQMAPASAQRQYDWSKKQVFSLSVTEIGSLVNLGPEESYEIFHDPNMGRSDEGKVQKVLKVEPLPDRSGHFFSLSVNNKLLRTDENIYIPVTKAEFTVLVTAFKFILPYLLGWNLFANSGGPDVSRTHENSRAPVDYWNR